ncbi:hypothetical protein Mgra_00004982 [Meloidogyne graminicola]|uniref:Uncharacterized protein n=1 Tax=Meloidogyne graminicola TaxID=189291 RepID=A0A8S9ZQZ0_9BILA|nr:hypothetical protein Mgra_00004982 [Meloidogyne graminicola]
MRHCQKNKKEWLIEYVSFADNFSPAYKIFLRYISVHAPSLFSPLISEDLLYFCSDAVNTTGISDSKEENANR